MTFVRRSGWLARFRTIGEGIPVTAPLRLVIGKVVRRVEARYGVSYSVDDIPIRLFPGTMPLLDVGDTRTRTDQLQLIHYTRSVRNAVDPLVADVGAFRGLYSVVAALACGESGHVFAFEPFASHIEVIERHGRLNEISERVTVVPAAVSDMETSAELYEFPASSMNSLLQITTGHAVSTHRVKTVTLDAFYAGMGRLPTVVKIDVEGAEMAVLRGAESIVRSEATIYCEFHPDAWSAAGHSSDDLRSWLASRGRVAVSLDTGTIISEYSYGPVLLARSGELDGISVDHDSERRYQPSGPDIA